MIKRQHRLLPILSLLAAGLISCSQSVSPASDNTVAQTSPTPTPTTTSQTAADGDLTVLFSKIWRVRSATLNPPAADTIYVFLPNGTLLQTSCTETYAISTWTIDKATPKVLQITENGVSNYTAEIVELVDATLRLKVNLTQSNQTEDLTLTAVEDGFTCPDLPR